MLLLFLIIQSCCQLAIHAAMEGTLEEANGITSLLQMLG
jgi:hypothetical protein